MNAFTPSWPTLPRTPQTLPELVQVFDVANRNEATVQNLVALNKGMLDFFAKHPQATVVEIWGPQNTPQTVQKLVSQAYKADPHKVDILLKITLLSPDGSNIPYSGGFGVHTVGLKANLRDSKPTIEFIDPLGVPPHRSLQEAIEQAFPGAQWTVHSLCQQDPKKGLLCSNWTWANLKALSLGRPLPKAEDLLTVLKEQYQMVQAYKPPA